ncbi:AraC family transcriptional regulator [Actinomyces viscosus]|uniref:AraC family transcriptional regulator n=1 Tax=Actinomyces viscosus TaxID=1656 RepID=UPI0028E7D218|nr:AraC family transcriptional regulator [Actinomyces viscosus]
MREHSPDGLMSPGLAHLIVPAVDGAQADHLPDPDAAGLALRATQYLRTHFRERLTVRDLSEHLAYSPSHLSRVFTAAVGTSPMDYLAAWRLHQAKHLLVAHRLGVAETCHEVGYTSVGTFSRRFLRDVGTPPGALCRLADRISERTLPAASLFVPAVRRIRLRLSLSDDQRRGLGPSPHQWIGTFPRPVPSGLPATGTLRRHIDEVELPVVPDAPWILVTVIPDGASVHEHLAPTRPLVARLRIPPPASGPITLPVRTALPWDPAVLVALAAMVV